jgi:hypothetical protein
MIDGESYTYQYYSKGDNKSYLSLGGNVDFWTANHTEAANQIK